MKTEKNEYTDIDISHSFIKDEIIEDIKILHSISLISSKNIVEDWFYITFKFTSYLWDKFKIKPIFIELLIDLIDNSIKYSDIWTKIDVIVNQTKEWITISVADEWFWIKNEDIEKIFEHGKRLDNVGYNNWNGIWLAKLLHEINKAWWDLFVKSKLWVWTEILFKIPDKK